MKNNNNHRLLKSILLPIGLLFFLFLFSQWQPVYEGFDYPSNSAIENKTTSVKDLNVANEIHDANRFGISQTCFGQHIPTIKNVSVHKPLNRRYKQRGAHVYGRLDASNLQFLIRNNIEWVTKIAWGFQENYDSPIVGHHNGDSLYILKSDSIYLSELKLIRSAGFKVFVKPHLWLNSSADGKWRSDVFPANEENWKLWKKSYRDFILRYANLAQKANAEMFCIGMELSRLAVEKPAFWKELIQDVRGIYSGKITYAANWHNEYEKITFWDDLDYIGVQAYFPLAKNKYPSVKQISQGWSKHFPSLESIHKKYNRKILFTELGYKSTADSAINPWEWDDHHSHLTKSFSTETQANCYEAFFNTVWAKEWFEGVHIWVLRSDHVEDKGKDNLGFTPLSKPAEKIMAKGFEYTDD